MLHGRRWALGVSIVTVLLRDSKLSAYVVRSVVIPEDEAERSGIGRDQVKISKEYGGGYPANVEGLHHLHCLVRFEATADT